MITVTITSCVWIGVFYVYTRVLDKEHKSILKRAIRQIEEQSIKAIEAMAVKADIPKENIDSFINTYCLERLKLSLEALKK
jgi:hypothetical protein